MAVTDGRILRVHDLVRFRADDDTGLPPWVTREGTTVWGVVRRSPATTPGTTALGLRGPQRSERLPLEVRVHDIVEVVAPEDLAGRALESTVSPELAPSLAILSSASSETFGGLPWGPTGSAGFELATRLPAVRATSDLDLILRADQRLAREDAGAILRFLRTLPCLVDCLLETPRGAVALAEWAGPAGGSVLLRTPAGPVLTRDPWQDDAR
ncbi:malonate decarboxylase holo-ACP synthase [Frondihabitans cladoniiphilus]|uniref:Malonate decarboxylase holo-ACP synthase n=1 Tax=Frondihabitans cladoniiphilus TaxID=715785 RepID=A0ABP8VHF6_9MICO